MFRLVSHTDQFSAHWRLFRNRRQREEAPGSTIGFRKEGSCTRTDWVNWKRSINLCISYI